MSEVTVHYVMLPTMDSSGAPTGSLQIPVLVRSDLEPGEKGELLASVDPGHLWWFSNEAIRAEVSKLHPGLEKLLGGFQ